MTRTSSGIRAVVSDAIHRKVHEWITNGLAQSPKGINCGQCEEFAQDVVDGLFKFENFLDVVEYANFTGIGFDGNCNEVFDVETLKSLGIDKAGYDVDTLNSALIGEIGSHVFIRLVDGNQQRYFDSECPEGVASPFQLPFAQRRIKQHINRQTKRLLRF